MNSKDKAKDNRLLISLLKFLRISTIVALLVLILLTIPDFIRDFNNPIPGSRFIASADECGGIFSNYNRDECPTIRRKAVVSGYSYYFAIYLIGLIFVWKVVPFILNRVKNKYFLFFLLLVTTFVTIAFALHLIGNLYWKLRVFI